MSIHLPGLLGLAVLLILAMAYPFLPGGHDPLAVAMSTVVQASGVTALVAVPPAALWLRHEARRRLGSAELSTGAAGPSTPARATLLAAALPILTAGLVSFAMVGLSLAIPTLALLAAASAWLAAMTRRKAAEPASFNATPLYVALVPVMLVGAQVSLARPLTEASRARAVANADELIHEIERHRATYGSYPTTLLALHKDYSPATVGVERYHYAPHGDAYTLFFEQPRFVFDDIGARELVGYNKLDQHVIPSHASWILTWSPAQLAANQGWFAATELPQPHWRRFLFD